MKCNCEAARGRYSTHLPTCPAFGTPVVWGTTAPRRTQVTHDQPAMPTYDEVLDAVTAWGNIHTARHAIGRYGRVLFCHTCGIDSTLFAPHVPKPRPTRYYAGETSQSRFD